MTPTRRFQLLAFLTVLVTGSLLGVATPAIALPGDLDPTFSGDGKVTTSFAIGGAAASDIARQRDGKLVAAGRAGERFAVVRYDPDGTLDHSFSDDGKVTTNFTPRGDSAYAVAIQPDGKIVVAGSALTSLQHGYSVAVARYNADGSLDGSFSGDGKVITAVGRVIHDGFTNLAWDVALQSNGKIVVVGPAGGKGGRFGVVRYTVGGSLDASFSGNGKVRTNFTAGWDVATGVAIQSDGKIVAVGEADSASNDSRFAVARYDTDGSLDRSLSSNGKATTDLTRGPDVARAVALQSDGKILAAGEAGGWSGGMGLVRYTANGSLDASFSGDGTVRTDFTGGDDGASDVAIQADGEVVLAGSTGYQDGSWDTRFALARYRTNGALDDSFRGDGKLTTNFTSAEDWAGAVLIQPNGKIVAGGAVNAGRSFAVARYLGG